MSGVDAGAKTLIRVGGVSGLMLGVSYVIIVVLFSMAGAKPSGDGVAWLEYLDGKSAAWWGIAALSVLTDLLFLPLTAALYLAMRHVNRNAMLIGATLLGLFVLLDLAVTWPDYASLITLSGDYSAATGDAQRAAIVAAANYPASVLNSTLWAGYVIGIPALGILAIGLVMLQAGFSRVGGWVGVLTGVLGTASVIGPFLASGLGVLAIPTSVLTTIWVLLAGYRLLGHAATD